MHDFYVYILIDPRTAKPFYVGKGRGDRCNHHLHRCSRERGNGNTFKNAVINKIFEANLKPSIEIIQKDLSEEEAFNLEKTLIQIHGRRDIGTGCLTNLTDGGEGMSGHIFSDERRKRISSALTGKKATPEQRKAQSDAAKRRERKPLSDETKQKIRQKALGRQHSDETKRKLSELRQGTIRGPISEETKEKISQAQKGKARAYLHGRIVSSETRKKLSEALQGKKYGPLDEQHRNKISKALAGKPKAPFSDEHKKRLSEANRQRVISEEAKINMRLAQQKRRAKERNDEAR